MGGSPGDPHFYLTWLQIEGSHNPLPKFDHLSGQPTELRRAFYVPLLVDYKGYNSATAERKRCKVYEKGHRAHRPSPGMHPAPHQLPVLASLKPSKFLAQGSVEVPFHSHQ